MKLILLRFLISLSFIYCIFAVVLRFILPYWIEVMQNLDSDAPEKVNTAAKLSQALENTGLLHIPVIASIGIGATICLLVIRILPRRRS